MANYNSGKFKGAKPYTVNQNGAKLYIVNQNGEKVTSLLGQVKQTFTVNDVSIPKFTVEAEMHPVEP